MANIEISFSSSLHSIHKNEDEVTFNYLIEQLNERESIVNITVNGPEDDLRVIKPASVSEWKLDDVVKDLPSFTTFEGLLSIPESQVQAGFVAAILSHPEKDGNSFLFIRSDSDNQPVLLIINMDYVDSWGDDNDLIRANGRTRP